MPFYNADVLGGIESYIRLVWFFTLFTTVLTLLMSYLYLSIRKTREQEQLNREFSCLVIEGLETERRRISRELHDTILPQVRDIYLSNQIREICTNLMPPDFSCLALKDAIAQLSVNFSSRSGIKCVCCIDEKIDFSPLCPENQLHVYRIVQESFNNIEKHSHAKNASVIIRPDQQGANESVTICVCDDGDGIKPGRFHENLGMKSIRQRASILNAKVDFLSEIENGLMVKIHFLLPSRHLAGESLGG